jgi:hypothetical protein
MLCICLTFLAGAFFELKTNFVFQAIIIGQDIASGMLKAFDKYTVLKKNWFEKSLVYRSGFREKTPLVNCCLTIALYGDGWRLTRII